MKWPISLPALKPRERLLAVGTAVVLVIVILDRLVLHPWLAHLHAVRQEIQRMEQALQHHQRLLARREQVEAQLAAYQLYLRPPLADELQMALLLKEIESIATQSHVVLGEVKPLAVEADALTSRYSLDVQFECTLEEWVEFVIQLEASPSLFQISRAVLSTQEESPDRLKASLRVTSMSLHGGAAGSGGPGASGEGGAPPVRGGVR